MRARWLAMLGGLGIWSAALATTVAPDGPPSLLPLFDVHVDPMRRLLLVNFEQDPDATYRGFEPQVFDDPVNGTGHLVIGWRTDGRVDVYHEPALRPDPAKFDIAGAGLAHLVPTPMEEARFTIDDAGVHAAYAFTDLHGRRVTIRVEERSRRPRRPFGLLAPMGDAAVAPSAMPVLLLHDFYFVRRDDTLFDVRIEGRSHTPDELPIRLDGARMLFTRYSSRPLIATLNPARKGRVDAVPVPAGATEVRHAGLIWALDGSAVRAIRVEADAGTLGLTFDPPFPDARWLAPGSVTRGRFRLAGERGTGEIRGRYVVARDADGARITLHPSGGWRPEPDRFALRFLYTVARPFRAWPKRYRWEAELSRLEADGADVRSRWDRR